MIPSKIQSMNLPKLIIKQDWNKLENIHEIAHSLDDIQNEIDSEIQKQSGQEVLNEKHSYLLYLTLGLLVFSIMLMIFTYITYKFKLTALRQPRYEMVQTGRSKFYTENAKNEPKTGKLNEKELVEGVDIPPTLK